MEIIIILGIFIGMLAGFFGVGGGAILVPILMFMGYPIQEAVGISILQMFISSATGSFLNYKSKKLDVSMVLYLGLGALIGGFLGPFVVLNSSTLFLEVLFLIFVLFAFAKFIYTPAQSSVKRSDNKLLLSSVGTLTATISSSIGIGGAILLTPFLNAYMGYELKKATAASLFFILFSSFSGTISWVLTGELLYKEGLILGFSSIIGVWSGLYLAHKVHVKTFKILLLLLYVVVLLYIVNKIFFT